MIVADVNVLLHALHPASREHDAHRRWLDDLVNGTEDLGLVDAVLTGVVRLATHPRAYQPPVDGETARGFVDDLRTAPVARDLVANDAVWQVFDELLADDSQAVGNLVPDAWIAAMTIAHGGRLATTDRGMARWPGLDWFSPAG